MIVVGIPSRNEASTIGGVVTAAVEGLRRLDIHRTAVLVNCDNGSTDGTPGVFAEAAAGVHHVTLTAPIDNSGKGTNVLQILNHAAHIDAAKVVLLDADVRSVEPDWIPLLINAVDGPLPKVATPVYRRNRYEANTTNHIAVPLMRAVFGVDIQQPLAGDFAFNRAFVHRAVTWPMPESAQLYGIDISLIAQAASHGVDIVEVPLGRKAHNPGFPKILYGSQQVIDALFHAIARQGTISTLLSSSRSRSSTDGADSPPDPMLVRTTVGKVRRYVADRADQISTVLPTAQALTAAPWGLCVDAPAWAELLADAVQAVVVGHLGAARDHLVALYLCRVMTYWQEIDGLPADKVDRLLDDQTTTVCGAIAGRNIEFTAYSPPVAFHPGYWAREIE